MARFGTNNDLPRVTFGGVFVKSWGRGGNFERRIGGKGAVGGANFGEDGGFSFHGNIELGKKRKRRKKGGAAFF